MVRDSVTSACIGGYLLLLFIVAYLANQKKRQAKETTGAEAGQFRGSFSAPVLALTTASTCFSGVTVAGIPGEVGKLGYISIRWLGAMCAIVASMLCLFPRLRKLSEARGYRNPMDFISDRYQSKLLTAFTTLCCVCSSVIYLTIQFNAFGAELKAIMGIPLEWGMVIFSLLVLVMEGVGGLTSVVYTDVVQAVIMLTCFLIVPFVLSNMVRGPFWPTLALSSIAGDDCDSKIMYETAAGAQAAAGCIAYVAPQFLDYPELASAIGNVFWFTFGMLAFPLNLHLVQRCYIARSDNALRVVMFSLLVAAFISYPPGVLTGLVQKTESPTWPAGVAKLPAFFGVMQTISNEGFVGELFVTVMNCAYLAAVMSTADSLIMGVTATISTGILRDFVYPNLSEAKVVRLGLIISAFQCLLGTVGGMTISPPVYGKTLGLANSFLYQVVPAYLLGLFTSVPAFAVMSGVGFGLATTMAFFFFGVHIPHMPDATFGAFVNLAVTLLAWFLLSSDKEMQDTKAVKDVARHLPKDCLTLAGIRAIVPAGSVPPAWIALLMAVVAMLGVPVWRQAGTPQALVLGLPMFAAVMLSASIVSAIVGSIAIVRWGRVPAPGGAADSSSGDSSSDEAAIDDSETNQVVASE